MSANNMIFRRCLDVFGLDLMDGEKCPVCEFAAHVEPPPTELQARYPDNEAYLLDGPLDFLLSEFVERGWVPST